MSIRILTVPAVEPVSLADIKRHLNIDHTEEDLTLTTTIVVARATVERLTGRLLISQTWAVTLDEVPPGGLVSLPLCPVASVESVTVFDAAGAGTVWPASGYLVDTASEPARLLFTGARPVPGRAIGGIEIRLTAGYGPEASDVPADLVQAVRLLTAHWYESRGDAGGAVIPADVLGLTAAHRLLRLAA